MLKHIKVCENKRNELDRPEGPSRGMTAEAILREQAYYRGRIDGLFFAAQFPEMILEAQTHEEVSP